jgi:hypothetical protein
MLVTEDDKRINAEQALNHEFFNKKESKNLQETTGEQAANDSEMESLDFETPISNRNISSIRDRFEISNKELY